MENNVIYDGHCHFFDSISDIFGCGYSMVFNKAVGFADVQPDNYVTRKVDWVELYEKFITKRRDLLDNGNIILLAAAPTAREMIEIYERHRFIIKGFGEIKCYNKIRDMNLYSKNLNEVAAVCEYMDLRGLKLPVYIHFTLTNDNYVQELSGLLSRYNNIPIVLCHCGMEEPENLERADNYTNSRILYEVQALMAEYDNLYCDISYTGLDFMENQTDALNELPQDRIILGKDANPFAYINRRHTIYKRNYEFNTLYSMIDNKNNICKLFKIE